MRTPRPSFAKLTVTSADFSVTGFLLDWLNHILHHRSLGASCAGSPVVSRKHTTFTRSMAESCHIALSTRRLKAKLLDRENRMVLAFAVVIGWINSFSSSKLKRS